MMGLLWLALLLAIFFGAGYWKGRKDESWLAVSGDESYRREGWREFLFDPFSANSPNKR